MGRAVGDAAPCNYCTASFNFASMAFSRSSACGPPKLIMFRRVRPSNIWIIASGGIMCAKLAMTVLAVKNYYIGWTFIPILAIGAGFNCLSSFQKSVYLLEKKTVPSFLSTAFSAVINIVLNALLIPRYGGTGAAAATLISYVALFIYRALDSRRFMPIHWKGSRLGLTVLLLAVQAVLMLMEPPLWLIWQLLLFGAVGLLGGRELTAAFMKLLHRHSKA